MERLEATSRQTSARLRGGLAGAVLVAAAGLLVLAVPRVQAALTLAPVVSLGDILGAKHLPPDVVPQSRAAHHAAFGQSRDGRVLLDAGALTILLANQAVKDGDTRTARLLFGQAEEDLRAGLALMPLSPQGWLSLAGVQAALHRPDEAADALRMSFLTGNHVAAILVRRLDLGLALMPHMNPETMTLLSREARLMARLRPGDLARMADEGNRAFPIRALLTGAASEQEAFERHLARRHADRASP